MKRLIAIAPLLLAGAAAVVGILTAHQAFASWVLDLYLADFVALPLGLVLWQIAIGREEFEALSPRVLSSSLSLLVVTIVYQRVTASWLWACATGVIVVFVTTLVRNRHPWAACDRGAENVTTSGA